MKIIQFSQELIKALLEETLLACQKRESDHFGKEVIEGLCSWGFETHLASAGHYTDDEENQYSESAYDYRQENGLSENELIPMVFNTYWEYNGQVIEEYQIYSYPNTLTIEEMLPIFMDDFQNYLTFVKEDKK